MRLSIKCWLFNRKITFKEKRLKVIDKQTEETSDYKELVRLTNLYNKLSGKKDDYLSSFNFLNSNLNSIEEKQKKNEL
jgi:hypothetical protein